MFKKKKEKIIDQMIEVKVLEKKKNWIFQMKGLAISGWVDNGNIIMMIINSNNNVFYRILFYRAYYVSSTALSIFCVLTHLMYVQEWDCRILLSIFRFLRNIHIVLHSDCTKVYSHQQCKRITFSIKAL